MKNKKGWIRIVEASIAVLFIAGVILVVINNNEAETGDDVSSKILNVEISVLREIQLNTSLRGFVLDEDSLPIESGESGFPPEVKDTAEARIPASLECVLKICSISDECTLASERGESVYAESVLITTVPGSASYSPRKLKIFCWEK